MLAAEPLITTIIPTYRRPKLLGRAIRSVLNQTYPHFRVSIYDNASGDETASLVEEFAKHDPRIEYHCRPENIGACRNFSDAAGHINTPLFSFLSDDDVLLPGFYKTALAGFEKFPEAMMSATASVQIDERGQVFNIPILNWQPGLYLPTRGLLSMLKNGHPEWTSVLFRRELLQALGPPDVEVGQSFDLDFQLRAAARFPMAVSLEPGALFVMHNNSTGISAGFEGQCTGWYKICCKIRQDQAIPQEVKGQVERLLIGIVKKILVRSAICLIALGDWYNANRAILYLSRYCNLTSEPFMLKLLSETCRHFGLSRKALHGLLYFRRVLVGSASPYRSSKRLQTQFGCYGRYLEL